ncbi:putative reverse transcriptase domain-containing protein [Tanacetum coccineum]
MDWLAYHRALIDCYEKIVRIPLPNGKILEVQGERPEKDLGSLACIKADEKKLDDIQFRIDQIPGASPVVRSPYRLALSNVRLVETSLKNFKRRAPPNRLVYSSKSLTWGTRALCQEEKTKRALKHMKMILDLLQKEKLYAKFSKCEFWLQEVQFLGHVVNRDGIHMDPSKVESVKNWKTPESSTEIRSFLGLAGYYRRFIENFSKIAKPLTLLTQKNKEYVWGDKQVNLSIYEGETLHAPRGKVIVYASRQLKKHENNYTTHALDLERSFPRISKAPTEWPKWIRKQFEQRMDVKFSSLSYWMHHYIRWRIRMYYDLRDCIGGLKIPEWKWEKITMDFVTKLPKSSSGHDTIWVVVDRLTKSAHFLPIREDYKTEKLAKIYTNEIVARHGLVPGESVGKKTRHEYGFTTLRHGRSEWRTISNAVKDMLRACVLCAPFEALYGRKCRSPVIWTEVGESQLIGPEIVQETTEKIVQIKERLKTARSRQKSYADKRRKPLEFLKLESEFLKVSPWKGVVRFGKKGKLAPRYVGPFEIVECVGPVAYRLKLPQELSCVHDTFHVSNLKKCLAEPDVQVPLDEIEIDENLRFVEEPIEIVERDVKKLKRRRIPLVKVRWNSRQGAEYTWEREDQFRKRYPNLFSEPVPSSNVAT